MSDKPVKLAATLQWAFIKHVDKNGDYKIDLCNLSKPAVDALKAMGIEVKFKETDPDKGFYITCKSQKPMRAKYDGVELPESVKVGNGSKGIAMVGFYDWTYKAKKGRSPGLMNLLITDLIEYTGNDIDPDSEDVL